MTASLRQGDLTAGIDRKLESWKRSSPRDASGSRSAVMLPEDSTSPEADREAHRVAGVDLAPELLA